MFDTAIRSQAMKALYQFRAQALPDIADIYESLPESKETSVNTDVGSNFIDTL